MAAADEAILKRVLPHSIEAEQSVIGSMIMDREAIVVASEIITGEDFYTGSMACCLKRWWTKRQWQTGGSGHAARTSSGKKMCRLKFSSLEFIRDLITAVPTSANVKYYAGIVAEKSTLRKLIRLNEEIANTCYAGKEGLEEILETTEKKVFDLVQRRNTGDFVPIRQVVMNAMDRIEKASRNKGNVTGIPTGFIDLDYKTAGLQPSDLILIAARPSMGKTAFVLNIAQNVAFKQGMTVAMFSLEMSKEQFVNRLFSLESKVDSQHLRTGNLTDAEWESLIESAGVIGKSNLIIDDTPGITIAELRSKCRKYKLEYDLKLIIIDYLQLMSGSGGRSSDSRQQEISDISRSLKALARELQVPVIALSQLSRAVEQRPEHRPMLSDLRESGAIEQDADMVCFIHRPEYYKIYTDEKGNDLHGMAEIIIAKHRNGAVGDVLLRFRGEYARFQNPDDDMIVPMPGEEKKAPVLRSKMNNGGGQDFVPPPPTEMPPMPDNPFGAPVPDVPF